MGVHDNFILCNWLRYFGAFDRIGAAWADKYRGKGYDPALRR